MKYILHKRVPQHIFDDLDEALDNNATIDTDKYTMAWKPKESPYIAFEVPNKSGDKLYLRDVCTEYKILSEIERQLKNAPNASGKIKLFTELECCDSCTDVIAQFLERHPDIEIEIVHNNNIRITK